MLLEGHARAELDPPFMPGIQGTQQAILFVEHAFGRRVDYLPRRGQMHVSVLVVDQRRAELAL